MEEVGRRRGLGQPVIGGGTGEWQGGCSQACNHLQGRWLETHRRLQGFDRLDVRIPPHSPLPVALTCTSAHRRVVMGVEASMVGDELT